MGFSEPIDKLDDIHLSPPVGFDRLLQVDLITPGKLSLQHQRSLYDKQSRVCAHPGRDNKRRKNVGEPRLLIPARPRLAPHDLSQLRETHQPTDGSPQVRRYLCRYRSWLTFRLVAC